MQLRIGQTLVSRTDDTAVIVVRSSASEVELTCGGYPMAPPAEAADKRAAAADATAGAELGKRYVDAADTLEVLCTKAGRGTLAVDGVALVLKQARALPSSD